MICNTGIPGILVMFNLLFFELIRLPAQKIVTRNNVIESAQNSSINDFHFIL